MASPSPLGASSLHETIFEALKSSPKLDSEPDDFLQRTLVGHSFSTTSWRRATEAVYRELFYSFAKDLELDELEQRKLVEVIRLLGIDDERVVALNYEVGLVVYKRRFRSAVADGELTHAEQGQLESIAKFFDLRKSDIKRAIADQAFAFYAFRLAEAVKDNVLTENEMSELALIIRQFGLSKARLKSVSVPHKKEILSAALVDIKGRGSIAPEDRHHIESLAGFLNAEELLKPCLMDLALYERVFDIRQGKLPTMDPGSLILELGEQLHFATPVIYETTRGGKLKSESGTLYAGSFRLRFVGLKRSHEIRYKNVLQVTFQQQKNPKIAIALSSGRSSGSYRGKPRSDPGQMFELYECIAFLVRKSRGLETTTERDSRYISSEIRSEVWFRDGGKCVICGSDSYLEFDHIIPLSKGGATSVDNLQLLCRKCNAEKSDRI